LAGLKNSDPITMSVTDCRDRLSGAFAAKPVASSFFRALACHPGFKGVRYLQWNVPSPHKDFPMRSTLDLNQEQSGAMCA
jgi:hypothetical protein